MNAIYITICGALGSGIPRDILERDFRTEEIEIEKARRSKRAWYWFSRRWAFWPQMGLLLLVITFSSWLPFSGLLASKAELQTSGAPEIVKAITPIEIRSMPCDATKEQEKSARPKNKSR